MACFCYLKQRLVWKLLSLQKTKLCQVLVVGCEQFWANVAEIVDNKRLAVCRRTETAVTGVNLRRLCRRRHLRDKKCELGSGF